MSEPLNRMPGQSLVLKSDAGHYSVWPVDRAAPPGWHQSGIAGTRDECLAWIEAHWTDMRPRRQQAKFTTVTPRY